MLLAGNASSNLGNIYSAEFVPSTGVREHQNPGTHPDIGPK